MDGRFGGNLFLQLQHQYHTVCNGFLNGRGFFRELEIEVDRARRFDLPLSVLVIKIANLAEMRSVYGVSGIRSIIKAVSEQVDDQGPFGQARLSKARELLKVLRRVPRTGGVIIMHGCWHSNEYSPKTGEGFEFWNVEKDAPMERESDFTRERINRGLSEFVRAGVYPVAFEAPHYAMSRAAYGELARHFSTYVGQIQISDETHRATLDPPFIIKSHLLKGMTVFPETLGYVNPEDPLSPDRIMERARMLKILRDADTCVFYHGFLPPEWLKEIIEGLKEQGYEFISLLDTDFWVQGQDLKVWGAAGKIYVETTVKPVDIEEVEPRYQGPKALIAGVVGLVVAIGVVLLSFVVIVWKLRTRRRYLYEER